MGMAVEARRGAVCGPSSVGNADVRVEDLGLVVARLADELLQGSDLADLLDRKDLILLVAVDGQTGRVVATVL
jgi:hypothetical protein